MSHHVFVCRLIHPNDLSEEMMDCLFELSEKDGNMYGLMMRHRKDGGDLKRRKCTIVLCQEDEWLVGWGFVHIGRYSDTRQHYANLQLFVDPEYRRYHVGTEIVKTMIEWASSFPVPKWRNRGREIVATPFDWNGFEFFRSCGLYPDPKRYPPPAVHVVVGKR